MTFMVKPLRITNHACRLSLPCVVMVLLLASACSRNSVRNGLVDGGLLSEDTVTVSEGSNLPDTEVGMDKVESPDGKIATKDGMRLTAQEIVDKNCPAPAIPYRLSEVANGMSEVSLNTVSEALLVKYSFKSLDLRFGLFATQMANLCLIVVGEKTNVESLNLNGPVTANAFHVALLSNNVAVTISDTSGNPFAPQALPVSTLKVEGAKALLDIRHPNIDCPDATGVDPKLEFTLKCVN